VRERRALPLEDAVRRLTHAPAQVFGIRGRGVLKPGYAADFMLFDPATVGRGTKRRVFDLPGGHPRLTTPPQGVHGVWVNGVRDLAKLPGKVLREFSA
jgi:N-acyl-D-aspartate/D-glutamate deacylase